MDFEQTVLLELGEIKALCATNAAKQEESEHRLDALENTNKRQWWMHALSPVLLAATAFAKKSGLI